MPSTSMNPTMSPDRALLSRVADSLYWMSRYIERAEHVARVLKINTMILMDVGDVDAEVLDQQWRSVMRITGIDEKTLGPGGTLGDRVARSLTFDPLNSTSLISCFNHARENARAIRSEISAEMWEQLNALYWTFRSDDTRQKFEEQPEELYNTAMLGSMLFQGICDQTLDHDQRWNFAQLAKSLERIDMTCRIIRARSEAIEQAQDEFDSPLLNIQWMAVLRMCCSIEAYRRQFSGDLEPLTIAGFLILEDHFPRSVRFNVEQALTAISAIRQVTSPNALDQTERILGRLRATLTYASAEEIGERGVPAYLQQLLAETQAASAAVQQTYFLK